MANFESDFDADKIFPKALLNEGLSLEMIESGQEILLKAIKSNANRHIRTGSMVNSLKKTKPTITSSGSAIGKVNFTGKDRNGMTNSQKAIWAEYGTRNYPADPMVRPAVAASESAIKSAMDKVFNQKVKL